MEQALGEQDGHAATFGLRTLNQAYPQRVGYAGLWSKDESGDLQAESFNREYVLRKLRIVMQINRKKLNRSDRNRNKDTQRQRPCEPDKETIK